MQESATVSLLCYLSLIILPSANPVSGLVGQLPQVEQTLELCDLVEPVLSEVNNTDVIITIPQQSSPTVLEYGTTGP